MTNLFFHRKFFLIGNEFFLNVVPKLKYFPVSKFVKQNEKNGNSNEITVFNQNSERRGSFSVNEFRENERKREIEENMKKKIENKTNINEKETENDDDDNSVVQSSVRRRGDNENNENKDEDDVEVEVEQTSRRKKTGQFKDVLRRSRSFSFSQKLARKNLEEKNNLNENKSSSSIINNNSNDNNSVNNDKNNNSNNNININNNAISDNNININVSKSYSFRTPSIVHSPYLLATTVTEGKLKLRASNSDDRLVWVTWLLSVIQSQQSQQ
jgi:hypothetical protein